MLSETSSLVITHHAMTRHAKRLRKIFAQNGVPLSTTESQEVLAKVFGLRNWHAALALFGPVPTASAEATKESALIDFKNSLSPWTPMESLDDFFLRTHQAGIERWVLSEGETVIGFDHAAQSTVLSQEKLDLATVESWLDQIHGDIHVPSPPKEILSFSYRLSQENQRHLDLRVTAMLSSLVRGEGWEVIVQSLRTPPELRVLGLPKDLSDALIKQKKGSIFVSGAARSGKTTTLSSIIRSHIEAPNPIRVITREDTIEFCYDELNTKSSVAQSQNSGQGLSHALRRRPDVILVDELRKSGEAAETIQASLTGHLVLSSVSSRSVAAAVRRMGLLFPQGERVMMLHDFMISLKVLMAQHMIVLPATGHRVVCWEYLTMTPELQTVLSSFSPDSLPTAVADLMKAQGTRFIDLARARFAPDELTSEQWAELEALSHIH